MVETNDFYDRNEIMHRADLRTLQIARLRETVRKVLAVPFYREALKKAKVTPEDIRSLDDIRRLPFTTKQDLRDNYPLGLMAVPREQLARIHGSSGTTGKSTFVPYTRTDMENWTTAVARFLYAGGLRAGHLAQIAFGYGLFTGGFGLHYGIEKVGAATLPAASGNTERQLTLFRDLKPQALICTPSYGLTLGEAFKQSGLKREDISLQYGFFGGEPWSDDMRERIEADLGVFATDNYGLSEVTGPGVSGECRFRRGMHFSEDMFLIECLNSETLEPVKEGERGELVITTLVKEAMPVLRYRTRDIASLDYSPCECGRTGMRMSRVLGRSDDMMIIRGVNVYPTQIEEALLRIKGTAPHYLIELTRPGTLDEVRVKVEMIPEMFSDSMARMEELRITIQKQLMAVTTIRMDVELVAPQTIERFTGKAKRVIDKRDGVAF